jgi:peptidoglycan-associated lipoprotein
MKTSSLVSICLVGAALTLGLAGCAHTSNPLVPIPDLNQPRASMPGTNDIGPGTPIEVPPGPEISSTNPGGIAFDSNYGPWTVVMKDHIEDASTLKSNTVYFDFDSATIKKTENSKLEAVSAFLKSHQADALRVEGNCDERGTEKYNLSLGQKRALAVREYLANLGVDPRQVMTVTYGALRPAVEGHTEAAFSKNRRDDFVVLLPKPAE